MNGPVRILLLEDNPIDADLVARELRKTELHFDLKRVETEAAFTEQCTINTPNLILSDFSLPTFDGLSALNIAKSICPAVPFILLSGILGEENAIESLRLGATDYVLKQRFGRLAPAVTRALREAEDRRERERVEQALAVSQQRMAEIVESIRDGLFTLDRAWRFAYVNHRAAAMFGIAAGELIGENLWERYPILLGSSAETLYRKAMSERVPVGFETTDLDGGATYDVRVYPSGEGISVYWIDITERKQAQQKIEMLARFPDENPNPIMRLNSDGIVLYANNKSGILLDAWQCAAGTRVPEFWQVLVAEVLESGKSQSLEKEVQDRIFSFRVVPFVQHKYVNLYGIDMTEQKQAEQELAHANEALQDRANQLQRRNEDFFLLNEMGGLLESCQSVQEANRVIAQSARKIFPNDCGALYVIANSGSLVETGAVWGYPPVCQIGLVFKLDDCWALRRGQSYIVQDVNTSIICPHVRDNVDQGVLGSYLCIPMLAQSEMLGVFYLQSRAREISVEKQQIATTVAENLALALASIRLRETLRQMAIRDPLTGLFNRRYFAESLERELHRAKRHQGHVGVLMLDLDHFKTINDTFGHDVGDAVLRSLAQQLQIHLRKEDVICRYGGEEFAIILPDTTPANAEKRAEGLRQSIQAISLSEGGQSVPNLSASFGVAVYPIHGETAAKVLKASDAALYQAKRNGRNCVIVAP